jgi:hypothetical protein
MKGFHNVAGPASDPVGSGKLVIAFSSEADCGSRKENALIPLNSEQLLEPFRF